MKSKVMHDDAHYLFGRFKDLDLDGARILITGSTGLIGRNLLMFFCGYLNHSSQKFNIDALSSSTNSIEGILHPNIRFISADLSLGIQSISLTNYDYIFHAATYGQPSKFISKPFETLVLNGPIVLDLTKILNPSGTFVFLSTSEIYSGSLNVPNTESDLGNLAIDNPRAPYVYGKLFGEVALMQMQETFRVKIARIALAYGPGTRIDDARVLNQFIQRGILEKKIELRDSGQAIRSYCYIRDSLEMLLNIAFMSSSEVYNVGANTEISIRGLAKEISEILEVPFVGPLDDPAYLSAPKAVKLDVSKYEKEFGKVEYLGIRDGLERTIQWQRLELFNESGSS